MPKIRLMSDPYDLTLYCPFCGVCIVTTDYAGECPHTVLCGFDEDTSEIKNTDICFIAFEAAPASREHMYAFREPGDWGEADQGDSVSVVISEMLPDPTERIEVMKALVDSADLADSIAPYAWGVTLFDTGFRLNVGQVEVLVCLKGELHINLVGAAGVGNFKDAMFKATDYASVPDPQCAFYGTVAQFRKRLGDILPAHHEFVKLAALSPSGKPRRGSPHVQHHSEELMEYARSVAAAGGNA